MQDQLFFWITQYGYIAIVVLIFLQEVGLPSPFPNEFFLLFCGYLSYKGLVSTTLVILSAVAGDLLASTILFETFYFFGKIIIIRKPKWLPLPHKKIDKLSQKLSGSGLYSTFICRLTPLIRGYTSVISGLLHIPHKKYLIILFTTSIIWSSVYVSCGYFFGPYQNLITQSGSSVRLVLILIPVSIIFLILLFHLFKNRISILKFLKSKT